MKKMISFILCFIIAFSFAATAFADSSAELSNAGDTTPISAAHVNDGTTITLWNHTDVIMRSQPTTSSSKVHTLYSGDSVYVYQWEYASADGYTWAYIRHYHSSTNVYKYGFSANSLLN